MCRLTDSLAEVAIETLGDILPKVGQRGWLIDLLTGLTLRRSRYLAKHLTSMRSKRRTTHCVIG